MDSSVIDMRKILAFIFLACSMAAFGRMRVFTTDNGLSSSLVNAIYQDRNGMVWIATEDGLNRFDGAKITVYKHNPDDEYSLCHNYVRTLAEDNDGNLLIGTYNGIQIYDPVKDCFSKIAKDESGDVYYNNVVSFLIRKNGEVWASGNSLRKLDISDGEIVARKISLDKHAESVAAMLEDRDGCIWAVIDSKELIRVHQDGRAEYYLENKGEYSLTQISEDAYGNIFVGTMGRGVLRYIPKSNSFVQVECEGNPLLPVRSLYVDDWGQLYVCTDGNGLKVLNRSSQKLVEVPFGFDTEGLNSDKSKVHYMFKDKLGNVWLGIFQKGVLMIPSSANNFEYIGYKSVNNNVIGSNNVNALYRDSRNVLWVGTDNDGIYGISENGESVHYDSSMKKNVPDVIMALYEDSEQNFWIGSYLHGLAKFDRNTGECSFIADLLNTKDLPVRSVYDIVEDREKRLWIATMGNGLFYYDLKKKNINRDVGKLVENDWITTVHYSIGNRLYVGTYNGIGCIDLNKDKLESEWFLWRQIVHSIYEGRDGNLWLGTSEGLVEWNLKNQTFVTYNVEDGLPSNSIYSVQGDDKDCLWLGTNLGLAQFNIHTHEIINYYVTDGLQGNEFSKNASFKDKNGIIYMGGVSGITYFNPQVISSPHQEWTIRISDFYLNNQSVRKGVLSGGKPVIDCPVYEAKVFNLGSEDNTFSIELTTLEPNAAERIVFHYSLGNDNWIALPKGVNRVFFSNLDYGNYRFRYKVVDNMVESEVKEAMIVIRPPWWVSWWMKVIYVVLFIATICLSVFQIRRQYNIRQAIMMHGHAMELQEAKLQFFINISHEIRTPMSLIISPLMQLMNNETDEEKGKAYRMIYRNAQRILRLVNQLMDVRKIDKGQMALCFQEVELVAFIDDLCDIFVQQSEQRNIKLNFYHDGCDDLKVWIDPVNFDKIVLNILSNAFKFTPDNGVIDIYLQTGISEDEYKNEYVEMTIADSGIGIDEKELEHIFERFYQVRNVEANMKVGTGIGLHLTRSLVELHHGSIIAKNNPDGMPGSRFIVRLPLGKKHIDAKDIVVEAGGQMKTSSEYRQEMFVEKNERLNYRTQTKFKVLIVEDDDDIRGYLYKELSDRYHVRESKNGKEALDMVFMWNPHLVISDVMMPEMDGLVLCKKIKQNINLNTIPVILLTAKVRDEDYLEGLEVGVDAYVTKPFNIDVLKKTIDNLIQIRERLKNSYSGQQSQADKLDKIEALSPDDKLLKRIMRVINENLSNPALNVEMITEKVGISRVHLHRKLKQLTNQSTRDFIRNTRLNQAAMLLSQKRYTIAEVAELTGFINPDNFSTAFKGLYGVSPTNFMERNLEKDV